MRRQPWGPYAVALAVLVVGLLWAGVSARTLFVAGVLLACPLMMMVMMRGMHGDDHPGHREDTTRPDQRPDDFHDARRG
jgi:hypothetical protein